MKKLNARLYDLRKERNLTQEEIASRLDVSRQTISNWETGSAQPTIDKMIELSSLYGLSLDELVGGIKEKKVFPSKLLKKMEGKKVIIVFFLYGKIVDEVIKGTVIEVTQTTLRISRLVNKQLIETVVFIDDIMAIETEVM